MKKDIHPTYFNKAKVKCACGNEFEVGSVMEKIEVEICGACHPFYTGEEKIIDTGGRVERFKKRMAGVKPSKPKLKKVVETEEPKEKEVEKAKKEEKVTEKTEAKADEKEVEKVTEEVEK